ncbi:MAG: S-layer homology domain-containing protein [Oscillospiraceae bacterium]|nr:S-layer homology domain-containing protein [Oscillospiraceae bacterium]
MRTLKKSLCLVLAVVMMFSLCVFGVSADTSFSDYSDIEYTKAVDLLTSLGVVTGYEDGSFDPDGTLTRAEGCAIITRLMKMDDDLSGSAGFTDTVGHWAEGYIGYCVTQDIVVGYGDGTFGPDDTLTGYAFMKMLLTACGYNAEEEGMTGTTWTIGTATLAKDQDLTDDISGVSYNDGVSRDVACQLAYNAAVKVNMRKWKSTSGSTSVVAGDVSVVIADSGEYYSKEDFMDDENDDWWHIITYTWNADTRETTDDFGRPATEYYNIDDVDIDITVSESADVILTGRNNASPIASALSGYKFKLYDAETDKTNIYSINNSTDRTGTIILDFYYINGVEQDAESLSSSSDTLAEVIEALGTNQNGSVIEFFANDPDNDDVITDIVVIEYTVGEVTKASTSGTVTSYTVKPAGGGASVSNMEYDSDDPDSATVKVSGSIAKDDIVTYVVAEGGDEDVLYIYATSSVEGYYSSYSTGNNARVTVDGTSYPIGRGVYYTDDVKISNENGDGYEAIFGENDNDLTLYLDQYGNAVWSDGDTSTNSSASNYVFVIETEESTSWGESEYEVRYVTQEGTRATVYADDDSSDVLQDGEVNQWLKRSNNSDSSGYYDFDTVSSSYSTIAGTLNNNRLRSSQSTIISSGDITASDINDDDVTSAKADSNTVFILRTKTSTYKVYSGLSKLPTYTNLGDEVLAYALIRNSSGYAVAVYVDLRDYSTTGDDDDDIIFLLTRSGTEGSGYDSSVGETYYTYDVVLNGAKTTVYSEDDDLALGSRTLVTYSEDGSTGWITDFTEVEYSDDSTDTKYGKFEIADGTDIDFSDPTLSFITTDGDEESITLTDGCEVYYLYGNGNTFVSCDDGYDLTGTTRDGATTQLFVIYKSSSNHTVETVYLWSSSALK